MRTRRRLVMIMNSSPSCTRGRTIPPRLCLGWFSVADPPNHETDDPDALHFQEGTAICCGMESIPARGEEEYFEFLCKHLKALRALPHLHSCTFVFFIEGDYTVPARIIARSIKQAGAAIGLIAALAWVSSAFIGRNYGLSFTGPTGSLVRYITTGEISAVGWGTWMILGVPPGAFIAAAWSNEFKWRAPAPDRMVKQLIGGLMMGFGAATAGGCNIGHSLTGIGALSVTSLLATIFIMLGSWLGTYLFFMRR